MARKILTQTLLTEKRPIFYNVEDMNMYELIFLTKKSAKIRLWQKHARMKTINGDDFEKNFIQKTRIV